MQRKGMSSLLLAVSSAVAMLVMGAGMAFASHPNIPLYTYQEAADQFDAIVGSGDGTTVPMMPVALDAEYKGFPYSPKATCGNCHNGALVRNDGQGAITDAAGAPITTALVSYADMNEKTFHAQLGGNELIDDVTASSQGGKAWTQGLAMFGKW